MSALLAASESVCAALWRVAWQAGLLILLALLVERLAGRRLQPRWRYALWGLVVLRLVVPVSPATALSPLDWGGASLTSALALLEDARGAGGARGVDATIADATSDGPDAAGAPPEVASGAPRARPDAAGGAHQQRTTSRRPAARERATREPAAAVADAAGSAEPLAGLPAAAHEPPATRAARSRPDAGGGAPSRPTWPLVAAAIWLAGALARLALLVRRERAFRRRLAGAPRVEDERALALLEECRGRLGLARRVELVRSELAGSPAVTGVLRPRVLLPAAVLERLDDARLRHVLLHELAHVKRGDVARQAATAVVACLWWFHPLVGLALARLRAAQESLRDQEALSAEETPAPFRYAETLLELLQTRSEGADAPALGIVRERRELRRRIEMIASFEERRARRGLLGPGACVALAWLCFTSAAPEAAEPVVAPAAEPAAAAQDDGPPRRAIAVERHRPPEAWRDAVRQRLRATVRLDLTEVQLGEALAFLREVSGVDVVLTPETQAEVDEHVVDLHTEETTVADALTLVLDSTHADLAWCLAREAILVGREGDLPQALDLRFYRIAPLLAGADPEEEAGQRLLELVYALSGDAGWDEYGRRIELLDDLLVVSQDERGHAAVLAVLEQLLNDGRPAVGEAERRRAALTARLDTLRVQLELEDEPAELAVQQLSALVGVPMLLNSAFEGQSVHLRLRDATARNALDWIAEQVDAHVTVAVDHVRLGEHSGLEIRMYPVGDLLASSREPDDLESYVVDLVRGEVEPDLWDECPDALVIPWRDLLVVKATPEAQRGIAQLLAALRRARE